LLDEYQNPISDTCPPGRNPRQSAAKKGRGGRRPGAGAPKGNMNALKHGLRSKQFAKMGALIAQSPEARDALLQMAERWDNEKVKADQIAANILARVITRGLQRGRDRLIVLPPVEDRRSITGSGALDLLAQHGAASRDEENAEINQTPDTTPANNQSPDTKTH